MKLIIALVCVVLISACTSLGRIDNNASIDSQSESYYLLGLNSDKYQVGFYPGDIVDGKFRQNIFYPASLFAVASNGYVMGKASDGMTLGLMNLRVHEEGSSFLGSRYRPCEDVKTMTFNVIGGKVLYLGDIRFTKKRPKMKLEYSSDIEAAKRYISKYHPQLKDKVISWNYELLPTTKSCSSAL
ncbi:MAG: hypothetical protein N0E54_12985 [Candidatus Thiodiazotropha taylori]|nr:hypothetical protein [Candidatus Thiodiazotropha endolucinida]MCW4229649.1 hypothetical protein [Candidatus Thiodiazotropha taylori]